MIKYHFLSDQTKESIQMAEKIFTQLQKHGVTNLPTTPEEANKFTFYYDEGEHEDAYVFFVLEGNNLGYFQGTIVTVYGTEQFNSAKFFFAN